MRAEGGVVSITKHPELEEQVRWLAKRGELARILPATFCAADDRRLPHISMRAVIARYPDAVLVGEAAARLSYWPTIPLPRIEAAASVRLTPQPGYVFTRRRIPPELIVEREGWRYTDPALTAIDLATFDCTDAIDIALRTRAATLAHMREALRRTPRRPGNCERTRLLLDSRDEPWSAAERKAHRLLRAAGIVGWRTNVPVVLSGQRYYLDVAFRAKKLAIEIDGRIHQLDRTVFESDRPRQNALMLAGWTVLRFTWRMIEDEPEAFVATVRTALAR